MSSNDDWGGHGLGCKPATARLGGRSLVVLFFEQEETEGTEKGVGDALADPVASLQFRSSVSCSRKAGKAAALWSFFY